MRVSIGVVLTDVEGVCESWASFLPRPLYGLPWPAFWNLLGLYLVNVFNASLEAGLLPFSQRHRLNHKNWRPISLLNVDYKLCACVLAGGLLKVIATGRSRSDFWCVGSLYRRERRLFRRCS